MPIANVFTTLEVLTGGPAPLRSRRRLMPAAGILRFWGLSRTRCFRRSTARSNRAKVIVVSDRRLSARDANPYWPTIGAATR